MRLCSPRPAISVPRTRGCIDATSAGKNRKNIEQTMRIPDDIVSGLGGGGDLPRRALEALAVDGYRNGRLTRPDLRRLFGFETSHQIDDSLKAHEVFEEYTLADLESEREGLRRLGP